MKRSLIWCSLGLALLLSAAWSQASKNDTEKAVAALEEKWLQTQKTNNSDQLAPLLADNLVNTTSEGKVLDRAETLKRAKATKYASADYTNLKVTVFGDTAIATGGFKGKGTDPSGKPFEDFERWTDTWVKMPNGQWQCVATQGTSVKM